MTSGVEARGHKMKVDDKTLDQVVQLGRRAGKVQVKYNHRSGVEDIAGYLFNFRKVGNKALADWQLLASHQETEKTLEKAATMPECFGLSAAFSGPDRGEKVGNDYFARCDELHAVDCVPNPAANPTGLFATRDPDGDWQSAASMGASAGLTAAALTAILGIARRRSKLIPSLKEAGKVGGLVAAGGAGSVLIANKLVGPPSDDEEAPYTKRGLIGGGIGGAVAGVAAPLLASRVPWIRARIDKAARKWKPAKLIRDLPLSQAAPLGAATGAVAGAGLLTDEGQQVDTLRNIRREKLRRDFADTRPRDGMGQFAPDAGHGVTPETAHAAYRSPAVQMKSAVGKAILSRYRASGLGQTSKIPIARSSLIPSVPNGKAASIVGDIPAIPAKPNLGMPSAIAGRLRAARFLFAARHIHQP